MSETNERLRNDEVRSFAAERRHELPARDLPFHADIGQARAAFDRARAAATGRRAEARDPDDGAGQELRRPAFGLPDPHPSFAPPNRRRGDEPKWPGEDETGRTFNDDARAKFLRSRAATREVELRSRWEFDRIR
ncbi:hypothetical protein [Albimonas pacifica]|uniref:Uncharacterized protein n=1 Tax=Albimonas pacifica TaxID=1114924 RepID=A0A1I3P1C6_9RHOB|nr:hypothetical protein [Albimonas pacifica]SFJ14836.1 hypothetical protein SAMN05216258_1159 [Albimonas pacifica]